MDTVLDERPGRNRARVGLVVPEPACRPGDSPDFSDLDLPGPGQTRRPDVHSPAEQMRDLGTGLIRVLDDDGRAVGPWDPALEPDQLRAGLRHMLTVREFDRRMLTAQRQGKTSFYVQCLGEEAIACGFQSELAPGDMNFPTYRQQGLLVTAGYPLELMAAQIYSNALDPLGGRQLPVMYSSRDYGFFSISGNLATQYVQAVGWAMAAAIKDSDAVAAAWIGDGATAEPDFHSALVFASTYNAPVVLNIVNNQWAISTYQAVARGQAPTFAMRGHAFGLPALRADGNDYLAVVAASRWALERARTGLGPTVIEWVTYRAGAHSTSDDPSGYRPKDEAAAWPLGDPIERLSGHLESIGEWSPERHTLLEQEVAEQVRSAQEEAEAHGTLHSGPRPSPREMFEGVYAEMPAHLRRQRQQAGF